MSKYIIKNCECKVKGKTTLCVRDIPYKKCENITDCIMKQIVEKCKDKMDTEFNSGSMFAEEILNLLQIEEVE